MKNFLITLCLCLGLIRLEVTAAVNVAGLYPSFESYAAAKPKPGACRLVFIRHGQSESNAVKSLDGRTLNSDLSAMGRQQAFKTGQLLARQIDAFHAVYSSPMKRTLQTAQAIGEAWEQVKQHSLPALATEERLLEKNYGPLEGASLEQYAPYKKMEEETISKLSDYSAKFAYTPLDGMESMADVHARVSHWILEIARLHKGNTLLVIAHNGVLKALFMHDAFFRKGVEIEYRQFAVDNASILVVECEGNILSVEAAQGIKGID